MNKKEILIKIKSILKQIIFLQKSLLIKKLKKNRGNSEDITKMIRLIAEQEGVDPILALHVAICESNLNTIAKRWNAGYGYDRGLYQWNEYFHPEISDKQAYDPETATRLFCHAVLSGHLSWWNASRKCWQK